MKEHIEVSLEWMGKQVDLIVPSNVSAHRLIELLTAAFETQKNPLPEHWHFIVKGRTVALATNQTLKELKLGNGEILQLIVGEENEII